MNSLATKRYLAYPALLVLLGLIALESNVARAQTASPTEPASTTAPTASPSTTSNSLVGPLRIVKLLWASNPNNAATTLGRSISTCVARRELAPLREALRPLQQQTQAVLSVGDFSDPRYAPALAAAMLDGSLEQPIITIERALREVQNVDQRQMLWQLWLLLDAPATQDYFLSQIVAPSPPANASQAERWTNMLISSAVSSHRKWTSQALIEHWPQLSPAAALAAIEPLTSNAESMGLLLDGIEQGHISKDFINTNQLRKWLSSDNAPLAKRIEAIWGTVRVEEDAARQQLVTRTLQQLEQGARGSVRRGRLVFDRVCSQCHALHGRGFEVGPNIAHNGRGNLGQLVSNILDPSLVIGEAFQAQTVLTVDGQVVSGLVAAENDRYIRLKVQGGEIVEFAKEDLEQVKTSSKSLMPEGVESQMQPQELFDLLAYLCLLSPLDSTAQELVPGTPTDFVQP